jgi:hypothetical protein
VLECSEEACAGGVLSLAQLKQMGEVSLSRLSGFKAFLRLYSGFKAFLRLYSGFKALLRLH